MNRRDALRFATSAALVAVAPTLRGQTPATGLRRVGVLAPSTREKEEITLKPLFDQMRALGWIEGQNIAYDRAYANDQHETLPALAAELAARKPELIYALQNNAVLSAKQATQTIPIVFGVATDPVGIGLVTSLARPGGNVTGMSSTSAPLAPKRIQLLREILPGVKRIGFLVDANNPLARFDQQALAPIASSLGLSIIVAEAANPGDFDAAVGSLVARRVDAILVTSVLATKLRTRLVELANQKRIPVVAAVARITDAGALFSYGASTPDYLRRPALLVDKILKGAKPADLPVEQPILFELVVNLKAAKALGITVPRSILLRADRVIE